jgi:hypothetical protein
MLLHVMENQQWNVWRLPKASYSHDGSHGWHTEWPRIRQLDPTDPQSTYLMHMHGLFFDFPQTFSAANFAGLKPIASYYKMPTDYCTFEGRIVMGKNDASRFANPLAQKGQSNLWFGTSPAIAITASAATWISRMSPTPLRKAPCSPTPCSPTPCSPRNSAPTAHPHGSIAAASAFACPSSTRSMTRSSLPVGREASAKPSPSASCSTATARSTRFLAENTWSIYQKFDIPAGETITHIFPSGFHAHWVRVKSSAATTATAQLLAGGLDQTAPRPRRVPRAR